MEADKAKLDGTYEESLSPMVQFSSVQLLIRV